MLGHRNKFPRLVYWAIAWVLLSSLVLIGLYSGDRPEDAVVIPILNKSVILEERNLPSIRRRFPQAFMLGAGKCGTGALRKFISYHPNVVVPDAEEMWFYFTMTERGETWHLSQMPLSTPSQVTIECSPAYFHDNWSMKAITDRYKSALFFVILRDPVDRAISHFLHDLRENPSEAERKMNMTEKAEYFASGILNEKGEVYSNWMPVQFGMYSTFLKKWLSLISSSRIHVVDGSNFLVNPAEEMTMLENFLGLPSFFRKDMFVQHEKKHFYCFKQPNGVNDCMKSNKGNKHPLIDKRILDKLISFYEPYNKELYSLIGRKLQWQMPSPG